MCREESKNDAFYGDNQIESHTKLLKYQVWVLRIQWYGDLIETINQWIH